MRAFCLDGHDNDTYAFRERPHLTEFQKIHQELVPDMSGLTRPGVRRCKTCAELLGKWEEPLAGVVVQKRKYDIGSTYDGWTFVSQRFKDVCESNVLVGLTFRVLPDDPKFFAIHAGRTVEFDAERRQTRFCKPCPQCGRFESVVGATPVYLMAGVAIGACEFVRTDLEFGSNDEKHPLLLCGEIAANALKSAKLKGLDLKPVQPSTPSGSSG